MKKVLKSNIKAGSKKSLKPRLLGSIVEEMLHGNSPLAKGYRQYIASQENGEVEEQGWHTNTELGCDVKTILRSDRKMKVGKEYQGIFRLDMEGIADEFLSHDEHFTFVETYISVTRQDNGNLRPNFKPLKMGDDFSLERYALGVYNELCIALGGLVEE